MIAYVDRGSVSVGDEVKLALLDQDNKLLTVMMVGKATLVQPSEYHGPESEIDEVTF